MAEKLPSMYAYTITDKAFGDFPVLNSANAWYTDKTKVQLLINAFKFDATYEEACVLAGITPRQLRYFMELHPEFCQVIEACRLLPILRARKTVIGALETNPALAFKYLERKRPSEFGSQQMGNSLPPAVNMRAKMEEARLKYSV